MAGIQITGLASGLNWQNVINELITADQAPETQWKAQQAADQSKISSLANISSDLAALQTAADSMSTGTTFTARTATVGDPSSGWSAVATAGTATGQYAVDVKQLATTSVRSGATNVGAPLSTTSDVSDLTIGTLNIANPVSAGTFTIDGAQITVAASDSLQEVFDNINSATNGAVTATYSPTTDTIILASSSPIVLGATNDTSNFLAAMQLYNSDSGSTDTISSQNPLGSVNLNATIAQSGLAQSITDVDSNGNGTFSINGVSIGFNVNTDTLQTVLGRIDNAGAGVTATFNQADSQFTLTNNTTGNTGISVSEASGGLLEAMGLNSTSTLATGKNAIFSVNNSSNFTSASNNLDASVDGIDGLTINATSTGTQSVTVGNDTTGITNAINNLISAYNNVQTYITSQTQITTDATGAVSTNPLSGNMDITNMGTDLQNLLFNSVSGLTGYSSLDQIGIGFTGTSPLLSVLDPNALSNAISTNPDQVAALFNDYPNGLAAQIDNFVVQSVSSQGVITTQTNGLNQDSNNMQTQIDNLQTQLAATQQKLTQEFTAMEEAESKYQNEMSTLNSILNGGSATTSSSSTSASTTQSNALANASSSTSSLTSSAA